MSAKEEPSSATIELNAAFLKSVRGGLKIAEIVVAFVAFLCYAVASRPPYIAATLIELLITTGLLLLYLFNLHKTLTFFFWPLIDVFNSGFASVFMSIVSVVALSTDTLKATTAGAIVGFMGAILWGVDGFLLYRKITFNQRRT
ncbi:chemokine-like factor [Clupea harengus]|uniref:Chemokine-like factor n=1 Tax=Clupea harengus TaxID=7950 RepID=A0A6P8FFX6_CLUHA|nr:chemokine-like factor [Clupea harengus]XP_031424599.1 chemokine-like factor [Clupea harengus]